MAGEIIKVYNSYENAVAGGTTGQVVVGTVSSNGGAVYNTTATVPYFIYKEYWYRIEMNDLALEVIIDWDDGKDNSFDHSNTEIIRLTKAEKFCITSHIYTKHGAFFPLIKAINGSGFSSKFYTNDANPDYSALEDLTFQTGTSTAPAGRQNLSLVREEKAASDKIPHFIPANRQPIAILKSDRKRIYAGIDNDVISGTNPLLYAYTDSTVSSLPTVTFEASNTESKQVREYANIEVQKTSMLSGISITNDTVPKGSTFTSGAYETTTVTLIDDVVSAAAGDANDGYTSSNTGKYWTVTNTSGTSYYVWYRQNAKKEAGRVTIATTGAGTKSELANAKVTFTEADGDTYDYWFNTGSESAPIGATFTIEVDISDVGQTTNDHFATALEDAIDNGTYIVTASASVGSADPMDATVAGAVVSYEMNVAGAVADVTTNNGRITLNVDTQGKNQGNDPSVGGSTAIVVSYSDGDSANTIATATRSALSAVSGATISGADAEAIVTMNAIGNTTDATAGTSGLSVSINQGADVTGDIANIDKLYKVKLDDIDALNDTDRVYILCHDFYAAATPTPDTDKCVAILSNGNPIVELNDPYTVATLDGSESYALSSNLGINNYSYDLDKGIVSATLNNLTSSNAGNSSDSVDVGTVLPLSPAFGIDDENAYTALNYGNMSRLPLSYTFDSIGNPMDSDSRFFNTHRLPRLQVEDTSLNTVGDATNPSGLSSGKKAFGGLAGDLTRHSNLTSWNTGLYDRDSGEIVYLILGTAGSFTKDATVTQASSGATGKVFRTTKNNKWLELYDVSGTFNTSNTITSNNENDVDTSITPSATTVGSYRILKEEYKTGRKSLTMANGSGRTNNHANNRTDSTATAGEALNATDTTFTVSSGSAFTVGDYIAIATDEEIMKVTNISSNDLTITRGEFATTAASHSNSAIIYKIKPNWLDFTKTETTTIMLGGNSTFELATTTNITDHPENFICMKMPQKYDKVYLRLDNTLTNTATEPDINISVFYTKGTSTNNVTSYTWHPLPILDGTQELKTSGLLQWSIPDDWASVIPSDLTWKIVGDSDGTSNDPETNWDTDGYGILIAITVKTPTSDTDAHEQIKIYNVQPVLDEHVEIITVEDPHHVSLNSIALAQSISYVRKGKYMMVEDRLGKADIRRIGASGGSIRFGGVDLGNDDTGRNKILSYQKNGTPVFLDITHKDDSKTRFFGKITNLSEDNPTGKMTPKWAVQMAVAHCIQMSSTGVMTTEKISLGGVVEDVAKYIL